MMIKNEAETEIHRVIRERSQAVSRGDVDSSTANLSDDVVEFDLVDPLVYRGRASVKTRAKEWIGSFVSPPTVETSEATVIANGEVAFSYYFTHVSGDFKTGDQADMWFRTTLCFQKIDGDWQIVHDHGSVPFNPETGKASLGLKPE